MNTATLWLQAGGFDPMNFIFIGALLFIMYFFLIRPQTQAQKQQQAMQDGLAKGDRVVTAGGLRGVVAKAENDVVTLEVGHVKGDKMRIDVDRARIDRKVEAAEKSDKAKGDA